MSKTIHEAGLAITLDGSMLVSVAEFTREKNPQELLRIALEEAGDLFIGVAMNEHEMNGTLMRLDNAGVEAAAYVIGARQSPRLSSSERSLLPISSKVFGLFEDHRDVVLGKSARDLVQPVPFRVTDNEVGHGHVERCGQLRERGQGGNH
jgi:hypothetical protein